MGCVYKSTIMLVITNYVYNNFILVDIVTWRFFNPQRIIIIMDTNE